MGLRTWCLFQHVVSAPRRQPVTWNRRTYVHVGKWDLQPIMPLETGAFSYIAVHAMKRFKLNSSQIYHTQEFEGKNWGQFFPFSDNYPPSLCLNASFFWVLASKNKNSGLRNCTFSYKTAKAMPSEPLSREHQKWASEAQPQVARRLRHVFEVWCVWVNPSSSVVLAVSSNTDLSTCQRGSLSSFWLCQSLQSQEPCLPQPVFPQTQGWEGCSHLPIRHPSFVWILFTSSLSRTAAQLVHSTFNPSQNNVLVQPAVGQSALNWI